MKIEIISNKKWKYRLINNEAFVFKYITVKDIIKTSYVTIVNDIIGGKIKIKKGYSWDGSSVPLKRITKFFSLGLWDSDKYCKKASLHHDVLYQLMKLGLISKAVKDYADSLYKTECIEGGMPKWEASIRFWALQKFGDVDKKENPIEIIEV